LPEGLVLWGVRSIYYILDQETKKEYKCLIKGKVIETDFQVKGRSETNPIVVGDRVLFNITDDGNGLITERKKRKNEFKRLKGSGRIVQTLFANVDYLIVVDSVDHPPLRPYFIDRCLFTASYMGLDAIIVFNKTDLLNRENEDFYNKYKEIYIKLGYTVLETSAVNNTGIDQLKLFMKDKISSFQGRSGVGKSSLIKSLNAKYDDIKIGNINKKYDRGIHTTTISRIYALDFSTMIIDTPGVRELSIYIDKPDYIENYFRDFDPYRNDCRYPGCQHINEPGCRVLEALDKNEIEPVRYESYLRIRETIFKIDDSVIS
jgi:ribosome biogenesis GTPase / thiamine phosphate phosphatase